MLCALLAGSGNKTGQSWAGPVLRRRTGGVPCSGERLCVPPFAAGTDVGRHGFYGIAIAANAAAHTVDLAWLVPG